MSLSPGERSRTPTARQVGSEPVSSDFTVHDEPGDLLPELDDATTGLITTAIWLGITSGYLTPRTRSAPLTIVPPTG